MNTDANDFLDTNDVTHEVITVDLSTFRSQQKNKANN